MKREPQNIEQGMLNRKSKQLLTLDISCSLLDILFSVSKTIR